MNTGEPDPADPLLRALAEHWEDVLARADDEQRARLHGLVDGSLEPDPVDARAALADELLMLLPADHPLVEVLRTGPMLAPGGLAGDKTGLLDEGFRLILRAAGDDPGGTPAPAPAPAPAPRQEPGHTALPALDEFDRQVQARLLALPSLSPEELRARGTDPDDRRLIRLAHPDRGDQLPAFQFAGSGQPWPVVRQVNERLDAEADPWGVTCWWIDPHARLDAAPAELIGLDRKRDALLLRAAAAMAVD
ncbi:hypothetical protein [Frankia sp. Mgl5]|uniref:hypothetical protein n=1 Tax=Frankia sp. Mgl5 TaxID=2933793 RepID=UPI00200E1270|nr:hypothetical protein [Frankia sp. Mgl5]